MLFISHHYQYCILYYLFIFIWFILTFVFFWESDHLEVCLHLRGHIYSVYIVYLFYKFLASVSSRLVYLFTSGVGVILHLRAGEDFHQIRGPFTSFITSDHTFILYSSHIYQYLYIFMLTLIQVNLSLNPLPLHPHTLIITFRTLQYAFSRLLYVWGGVCICMHI